LVTVLGCIYGVDKVFMGSGGGVALFRFIWIMEGGIVTLGWAVKEGGLIGCSGLGGCYSTGSVGLGSLGVGVMDFVGRGAEFGRGVG
jgi:hypothetical protein